MNHKLRIALVAGQLLLASGIHALAQEQPSAQVAVPDELDLSTALQFALENNFDILQAKQRIEEQNGLIIEVQAQTLPNVSLDGGYTERDGSLVDDFGGLFPAETGNWNLTLRARQLVYRGGGVKAALRAQELVESAALYELQSVINEAFFQVRQGFYNTLLARESIGVQRESVALLEEQLQDARNRFEAGSVSQFEVLRAEVELANAQAPLIKARNDFRLSVEELRQLLGYMNDDPTERRKVPEFVGSLEFEPVEYDLDAALDEALESRPELKRLEQIAEAREAGIQLAKSGYYPEVNVTAGYGAASTITSVDVDDALVGWTVGIESNWNLFDGRRTKGQVIQARSQYEQAALDLRRAQLQVEIDTRRALSDLQQATELAGASVKVVDQAEEALRLANARYSAGEATQLDLLQAQVSLTEARLNQVQAFHSYNVAKASARKAIGITEG